MSGIAGIIHFDGRPVEPGLIEKMTDAMAHRGSDGINHWVKGSVALGQCMLRTTPESLEERQPLTNEDESLVLVMDGRVDNWEELRRELLGRGAVLRNRSDAELVLRAYEVWGGQSPHRILGDFAYVVWDHLKKELFCARDIVGLRPFYYSCDGSFFIFGSSLRVLFQHPSMRKEPNEGMVAEYLSSSIKSREETLYNGIFRLPPAYFLKMREGIFSKRRYWEIDPSREIRYSADCKYAEHFSEVFLEAVSCRMRSYGPVSAELSGGVDSSSIVAVIKGRYATTDRPDIGFETFAMGFPGLSCDETGFARSVVEKWNVTHHIIDSEPLNKDWYLDEMCKSEDFPIYPTWAVWNSLWSSIKNKGFRVVLNGAGGDEWLTGSMAHYADFLRRFDLKSLIRQWRADRQFADKESVPAINLPSLLLLRAGILPLLPYGLRRIIKKVIRRDSAEYGLVAPGFARRIRLSERLETTNSSVRFPTFAQQAIYRTLSEGGWMCHGMEMRDRLDGVNELESRFPFMDRRVIEFSLAIPEVQRWRDQYTKFVLRNAMKGLLPEQIRNRRTKADFGHVFFEAYPVVDGDRYFRDLGIASIGWVDGRKISRMYEKMLQSQRRGEVGWMEYIWTLWMVLGIELWYRWVIERERG